jgi:hypothetical protein
LSAVSLQSAILPLILAFQSASATVVSPQDEAQLDNSDSLLNAGISPAQSGGGA